MSSERSPVVTEEPLPGWQRYEMEGEKPWFKTPVPRTVIRDASKLQDFLEREHSHGRMKEVDGQEFSFKRRLGLQKQKVSAGAAVLETLQTPDEVISEVSDSKLETASIVERLTRNSDVLDHKKLLYKSSKDLDRFRQNDGYQNPVQT